MKIETRPFVPPAIERRVATDTGLWASAKAARSNALQMWPPEAYEQDSLVQTSFGRSRFLLNGEDAIHRVLVGNAKNYRRTPASIRILRPIAGDGLLLSEGAAWRRQRQTVAPALSPRVIPMLAQHVVVETDRAIGALSASTEPVSLLARMQDLTLEIAGRSMFSMAMERHGAPMRRLLAEYGAQLGRPSLLDYLLPPSIPTMRDLRRWLFRRRWIRLMDRIVAERSRSAGDDRPRDLFDLLRSAQDPDTGASFTASQLRDQTATLILAGHETTALTIFWSLYLLAHAPDMQRTVADEARAIEPSAEAARHGLPSLRRTRAVVQEAMRLYPPAFTLARAAIENDQVGGLAVPAGSIILIAPWVLHRHRLFWRDPDAFDPTRFEGEPTFAHRFAYLPFGAGPRVCVGAQFALTEATLVLAMLVRAFEITPLSTRPVRPTAMITTAPDHEPTFRLTARG